MNATTETAGKAAVGLCNSRFETKIGRCKRRAVITSLSGRGYCRTHFAHKVDDADAEMRQSLVQLEEAH